MAKNSKGLIVLVAAAAGAAIVMGKKKGGSKIKDLPPPPDGITRPDTQPTPPANLPGVTDDVADSAEPSSSKPNIDLPMPEFSTGINKSSLNFKDAFKPILSKKKGESAEELKIRCESFLDQMLDEDDQLLELAEESAYEKMLHQAHLMLQEDGYPLEGSDDEEELALAAFDELIPDCGWKMMDTGVGPLLVFGPANTIDQRAQIVHEDFISMAKKAMAVMNAFHQGDAKAIEEAAHYGIEEIQ